MTPKLLGPMSLTTSTMGGFDPGPKGIVGDSKSMPVTETFSVRTWWDKALLLVENRIRSSNRHRRDRVLLTKIGEGIHEGTPPSVRNGSLSASLGTTSCRTIEGLKVMPSR